MSEKTELRSTESMEPYKKVIEGYRKDKTIEADGTYFHDATLDHCVIVYSGGEVTWTSKLKVINCIFRFRDSAQRTVKFLQGFTSAKETSDVVDLEALQVVNDLKN